MLCMFSWRIFTKIMKILIAYYSRTGVTRKVAESIAKQLCADIEELIDTKKRSGRIGFLAACKDAVMEKVVPIAPIKHNPADYDLVVVGTPVWAKTTSSAVRTYLTEQRGAIKQAAFFSTTHTDGIKESLRDMQNILGQAAQATAGFRQKQVIRDEYFAEIDAFVEKINQLSTCPAETPNFGQ